jgi:hypothetical protein
MKYLLALLLAAAGCSGIPTQPDRIAAGQPFDLAVGQTAVTSDGLRVRFDQVRSDSRCPMDALCVRAGEAEIGLTLSQPGAAAAGRELQTAPDDLAHASYSGFTITLSQLQPYPRSDRAIQPADYLATLVVSVR